MRTASNSPLTQKYGDKTTHVSITVLFVFKLIGSPVLTQLRTGPKKCRFSIPNCKNRVTRGAPRNCLGCVVPKHATDHNLPVLSEGRIFTTGTAYSEDL